MIAFLAGWIIGGSATFLILGYGWSLAKANLQAEHDAAIVTALQMGTEAGRREASVLYLQRTDPHPHVRTVKES